VQEPFRLEMNLFPGRDFRLLISPTSEGLYASAFDTKNIRGPEKHGLLDRNFRQFQLTDNGDRLLYRSSGREVSVDLGDNIDSVWITWSLRVDAHCRRVRPGLCYLVHWPDSAVVSVNISGTRGIPGSVSHFSRVYFCERVRGNGFKQRLEFRPRFPIPPFPDTSRLTALNSARKLKSEGYRMRNCCYSYAEDVRQRKVYFYHWSLKGTEVTVALADFQKVGYWTIFDLRTRGNKMPSPRTHLEIIAALTEALGDGFDNPLMSGCGVTVDV